MSAALQAVRTAALRASVTAAPLPLVGQVGSWRLTRLVSAGQLCRVYQAAPAESSARTADYAVKLLTPEHEQDSQAVACFRREAEIGSRVAHPHLVPVLMQHATEPPYYLVMPWLAGTTLEAMLRGGPLSIASALWIARQVASALDALHSVGWLHGDIKPANMMVSPLGHTTLLDLGFAVPIEQAGWDERSMQGTFSYLAPERFDAHRPTDIRSDLYSLGVTLFEMLTGRVPFTGRSAAEIIGQHRSARPDSVRRFLPHVPREIADLVARMLSKEPLRRPQTPREALDQLARLEISLLAER